MSQRISTTDAYSKRFIRFGGPTATSIQAISESGNLTESFKQAKAVADTQRENLRSLMNTTEEMIAGLTTFQQNADVNMIKNIPLPTREIKESAGQSFGYVRLSLRYLQAGFLHFMEQSMVSQQRLEELEKHITKIAGYNEEVEIHGELVNLDLNELESLVSESNQATSTPPPTPPQSQKAALQPVQVKQKEVTGRATPSPTDAKNKQRESKESKDSKKK